MVPTGCARTSAGAPAIVVPAASATKRRRVSPEPGVLRFGLLFGSSVTLVSPITARCSTIRERHPDWLAKIIGQICRYTNRWRRPQAPRRLFIQALGLDHHTIMRARRLERNLAVQHIRQHRLGCAFKRLAVAASAAGHDTQNIALRQCQSRLRWD